MQNQRILFFTDNEALVHVINKQSCRDNNLMLLVRRLGLVCLEWIFVLKQSISQVCTIFSPMPILGWNCRPLNNRHQPTWILIPQRSLAISGTSYLLRSSLQPSSILTYQRAWKLCYKSYNSVFDLPFNFLPISPSLLPLFTAYMFKFNYVPCTVTTDISALGYSHKL